MQVSRIIVRAAALVGLALALALGSMAVAPSFAGAQDEPPGYDGYDGEDEGYDGYDGEDTGGDDFAAPPPPPAGGGDTLPLTGAPTLLAAAFVIGGVGIAVRRFSSV